MIVIPPIYNDFQSVKVVNLNYICCRIKLRFLIFRDRENLFQKLREHKIRER